MGVTGWRNGLSLWLQRVFIVGTTGWGTGRDGVWRWVRRGVAVGATGCRSGRDGRLPLGAAGCCRGHDGHLPGDATGHGRNGASQWVNWAMAVAAKRLLRWGLLTGMWRRPGLCKCITEDILVYTTHCTTHPPICSLSQPLFYGWPPMGFRGSQQYPKHW